MPWPSSPVCVPLPADAFWHVEAVSRLQPSQPLPLVKPLREPPLLPAHPAPIAPAYTLRSVHIQGASYVARHLRPESCHQATRQCLAEEETRILDQGSNVCTPR